MRIRLNRIRRALAAGLASSSVLIVAGCVSGSALQERADAVAAGGGLSPLALQSGRFGLVAYGRLAVTRDDKARILTVYIEGDGREWPASWAPPADPTPREPVALWMAAGDASPAVAWLARPCQYAARGPAGPGCDMRWWTSDRYAPEVLDAMGAAVDDLKARAGADRVNLVGYSGGGVVAALLAARRGDVARLVTVAAPLDLAAWTTHHRVSALPGPDPGRETARVAHVPQIHLAGGVDAVVPAALIEAYALRSGGRVLRMPEFDHHCCWAREWTRIFTTQLTELREP